MVLLAVFPPLFAFLIAFLFGRQIGDKGCQFVTCAGMIIAAVASGLLFGMTIPGSAAPAHVTLLSDWIVSGDFKANWALRIDALSVVMMCVVNIVSACVHVYSVGYMAHDPAKGRFMSYLSLFTFAMLMLVTSDNLIQLFFGWEGVGLMSYLLIGFWNHKPSANAAANKAFVVNRIGDWGLSLGIMACFVVFGTVQFDAIFEKAPDMANATMNFLGFHLPALNTACLLLFIGACGKSAQLGLHTWLPDAMEGPTPVSALIHAATMVTAGVFLVARFSPVFEYAPVAREVVCVMGALTCFVAATIGLTQFDIKRVIAYSTMSQLGYMFFALGVSAYSAAIFHLMTHAFFKALLFLSAGSVIHAMSDEQDMRKMGGLWRLIPTTYVMMWIGSLALAGVPFFSGYYSKDTIIGAALASHTWFGTFAFWSGIASAFMTAFYSWRLIFLTFHGAPRASEETMHHMHESPSIMITPLIVLAAGAIFAGALFYGGFVGSSVRDGHSGDPDRGQYVKIWDKDHFWGDALKVLPENDSVEKLHHDPVEWAENLPTVMGVCGILLAWFVYVGRVGLGGRIANAFKPIYLLFFRKWYFDELYDFLFVRNTWRVGRFLSVNGDHRVIDGLGPDGLSFVSRRLGGLLSRAQTGFLYHYAFVMMIGLIGIVTWLLYKSMQGY
jgi:NADH-quinone oxidoreductase subunit L